MKATIKELHAIAILTSVIDTLEIYTTTLYVMYNEVEADALRPIIARKRAAAMHKTVNVPRYRKIANVISQNTETDIQERLNKAVNDYFDILFFF